MTKNVKRQSIAIRAGDVTLAGDVWQPRGDGRRPGVVLIHGFASDRREMARPAAELARRGVVALSFDLRGHGQSSGVYAEDPIDDVLAAVAALARQPAVDRAHLALVGHSIGGRLALLAAAREPAIAATVALAPADDANAQELLDKAQGLPIGPVEYPGGALPLHGAESHRLAQMIADMRRLGYRLTVDWARMARSWAATQLSDIMAYIAPRPFLLVHCLWDDKASLRHTLKLYLSAQAGRNLIISLWGVHSSTYRSTPVRWLWMRWLTQTLHSPAHRPLRILVPSLVRQESSRGE